MEMNFLGGKNGDNSKYTEAKALRTVLPTKCFMHESYINMSFATLLIELIAEEAWKYFKRKRKIFSNYVLAACEVISLLEIIAEKNLTENVKRGDNTKYSEARVMAHAKCSTPHAALSACQSKEESKDQESIQSSTIPDPGQRMDL